MEEKERQEKRKRGPKLKVCCFLISIITLKLSLRYIQTQGRKERMVGVLQKEASRRKERMLLNLYININSNFPKHT